MSPPVGREIESFLRSYLGLHPQSIGSELLNKVVRHRMSERGASSEEAYLRLLRLTKDEREALCEELVVAETWFFRDSGPFSFLRHHVVTEWVPTHDDKMLRILCAPCSTGEEAYSIVMTLLDAGLGFRRFVVDAVDISRKALVSAGRAVYGKNSFRGGDLSFRSRFFDEKEGEFHLHETVKQAVRFMWGNLADPGFLADASPYHMVFCRNILIYFDAAARKRLFRSIDRLLVDSGLLFLGHAEVTQASEAGYRPVSHPRAFACFKPDRPNTGPARPKPFSCDRNPVALPAGGDPGDLPAIVGQDENRNTSEVTFYTLAERDDFCSLRERVREEQKLQTSSIFPPPGPLPVGEGEDQAAEGAFSGIAERPFGEEREGGLSRDLLDLAAALADQGKLEEAAGLCQRAMTENGPSPRAYLLLGLIRESAGDRGGAEELFNRVVYLDPYHYEGLIHLALLAEQRGDSPAAERLRRRAARTRSLSGD